MISGSTGGVGHFGSGCLLDDLIQFVYSGEGCRLMLVGDTAQLPPVGEELSPALSRRALEGYGLHVWEGELTQVVRQHDESGILWNATRLRHWITADEYTGLPQVRIQGFPDIRRVPGDELIEALEEAYSRCGLDQTIVVTRSNKRANIYNNGIRGRILGREEELTGGDQLLVAKNNYFWTAGQKECPFDFWPTVTWRSCGKCGVRVKCTGFALPMCGCAFPIMTMWSWRQRYCWIRYRAKHRP